MIKLNFLLPLITILLLGCAASQITPMPTETPPPIPLPTTVPLLADAPALTWEYATIKIADTSLEYATLLPPDFDPAKEYPLLLALPPGGRCMDL